MVNTRECAPQPFGLSSKPHRRGWLGAALTAVAAYALSACESPTGVRPLDPAFCPQTYEFGNYGCARVVALFVAPSPPTFVTYTVRVTPVRANAMQDPVSTSRATAGPLQVDLTNMFRPPVNPIDTMSVWIVGRMTGSSSPPGPGVAQTVMGIDSVVRVIEFAPVRTRRIVDTVSLTLHAP